MRRTVIVAISVAVGFVWGALMLGAVEALRDGSPSEAVAARSVTLPSLQAGSSFSYDESSRIFSSAEWSPAGVLSFDVVGVNVTIDRAGVPHQAIVVRSVVDAEERVLFLDASTGRLIRVDSASPGGQWSTAFGPWHERGVDVPAPLLLAGSTFTAGQDVRDAAWPVFQRTNGLSLEARGLVAISYSARVAEIDGDIVLVENGTVVFVRASDGKPPNGGTLFGFALRPTGRTEFRQETWLSPDLPVPRRVVQSIALEGNADPKERVFELGAHALGRDALAWRFDPTASYASENPAPERTEEGLRFAGSGSWSPPIALSEAVDHARRDLAVPGFAAWQRVVTDARLMAAAYLKSEAPTVAACLQGCASWDLLFASPSGSAYHVRVVHDAEAGSTWTMDLGPAGTPPVSRAVPHFDPIGDLPVAQVTFGEAVRQWGLVAPPTAPAAGVNVAYWGLVDLCAHVTVCLAGGETNAEPPSAVIVVGRMGDHEASSWLAVDPVSGSPLAAVTRGGWGDALRIESTAPPLGPSASPAAFEGRSHAVEWVVPSVVAASIVGLPLVGMVVRRSPWLRGVS